VTNAALDAVWDAGVRHVDMPITPVRMWSWLNAARIAAE
jgi:carbon-monoxide dehydrogenase large subunit